MSNSMNLPIPVVGTTPGPEYADNINASLTKIAEHDHTIGSGIPIGPGGINIDASLPFNNHSATALQATTFQSQAADAASLSLYVKGSDLYYNNGSLAIQLTTLTGIAGTPGSISNLISPASAVYGGGLFSFYSNGLQPAEIKSAALYLGNNSPTTKYLNLQPPAAMGANYSLVLPSLPAQTNVMTLDINGNMSSITYDAVGQGMTDVGANEIIASVTTVPSTQANLIFNSRTMPVGSGLGQYAEGSLLGPNLVFTCNPFVYTPLTGVTVSLTVSGNKPVRVLIVPEQPDPATVSFPISGVSGAGNGYYRLNRNGTPVQWFYFGNTALIVNGGWVDTTISSAGTVTYTLDFYAQTGSPMSITFNRVKMTAYEF